MGFVKSGSVLMGVMMFFQWGHANPVTLKNFSVGGEGLWETTATMLSGPQKGKSFTQKSCSSGKTDISAELDKALGDQASKCENRVLKDTSAEAELKQTCKLPSGTSESNVKYKKLSDKSFEVVADSNQSGFKFSVKTVSKYLGPCTPESKKASPPAVGRASSDMTQSCNACKNQAASFQKNCEKSTGPEKANCTSMLSQLQNACKMACGN